MDKNRGNFFLNGYFFPKTQNKPKNLSETRKNNVGKEVIHFSADITPVQPATPVGGTVQIKQLIVVPDRVLCTRYFVL